MRIEVDKIPVNIRDISFELELAQALEQRIIRSCKLIIGTLIVLRTHKDKFEYGIVPPKDYEYFY